MHCTTRRKEALRQAARKKAKERAARAAAAGEGGEGGGAGPSGPLPSDQADNDVGDDRHHISPLTVLLGPGDHGGAKSGRGHGGAGGALDAAVLQQVLGAGGAYDALGLGTDGAPGGSAGHPGAAKAVHGAGQAGDTQGVHHSPTMGQEDQGGAPAAGRAQSAQGASRQVEDLQRPAGSAPVPQAPESEAAATSRPPGIQRMASAAMCTGAGAGAAAMKGAEGGGGGPSDEEQLLGQELLELLVGPGEADAMREGGEAAAARAAAAPAPESRAASHLPAATGSAASEATGQDEWSCAPGARGKSAVPSGAQPQQAGALQPGPLNAAHPAQFLQPRLLPERGPGGQAFLELMPARHMIMTQHRSLDPGACVHDVEHAASATLPHGAPHDRHDAMVAGADPTTPRGPPPSTAHHPGQGSSHTPGGSRLSPLEAAAAHVPASPARPFIATEAAANVAGALARVPVAAELLAAADGDGGNLGLAEGEAGIVSEPLSLPLHQRLALSRWGERLCYHYLLAHPTVRGDGWTVEWVNQGGESGRPYDLLLRPPAGTTGSSGSSGKEEDGGREVYVEVKATRSTDKRAFEVSAAEVALALDARHR